jgi:myo-inositol 2-dehydrogenase/D-chiro-inositol 1-dehydrogenase
MSVKVCMIGCGSFARLCHGPAQRKLRDTSAGIELAACCDADPKNARSYCESFGYGRFYTDVRGMLSAEKPDAVIAAVPPPITPSVASLVLKLGFPLLLEKPPGLSPAELEQLISAAREGSTRAQVGFNRRYMPVVRRAMEILGGSLDPGNVGRIDYEMIRYDRWDADFSTTAIHAIDGARYLARSPFLAAEISFQDTRRGERVAANVVIDAECESGTRVQIRILPVSSNNSESAWIHGVGQSVSLKIPVSPQSRGDGTVEHWREDALVDAFSDRECGPVDRLGVLGETLAFTEGVRTGAEFSPGLADCRQQVALMEAVRKGRGGPIAFEKR